MKILMCTQEYYPKGSGIANVAYYLVKELEKKGHSVVVLSPYGPNIKIGYEKAINKYAGLGLIQFWKKVTKFINKNHNKFDKIIVHNPLFLKKIKPGKKTFAIVHTTYVKYFELYKNQDISLKNKIYYIVMKYIEKRCYKKNKFASSGVSPEVCKELRKLDLKKEKITYIPNGVDTKKFKPLGKNRFRLKVPKGHKILLSVGRLNQQKQPDKLIRTFEHIEKKGLPYSLVFAGDGELLEKCKKLVKSKKLNNIIFLDKVNHTLLPALYSRADFFIMSSCYEGQPLTLLEGMSCGLPCILSDIPNLSHFVKDSGAGVVVNFRNQKNASENIIKYLESTNFKKESKKVSKFTVNNLDWKRIAEKYLEKWEMIKY